METFWSSRSGCFPITAYLTTSRRKLEAHTDCPPHPPYSLNHPQRYSCPFPLQDALFRSHRRLYEQGPQMILPARCDLQSQFHSASTFDLQNCKQRWVTSVLTVYPHCPAHLSDGLLWREGAEMIEPQTSLPLPKRSYSSSISLIVWSMDQRFHWKGNMPTFV